MVETINPLGVGTRYGYDALGRRITQTSPDSFSCSCSTSKAHDLYYSDQGQVLEDDAAWSACGSHTDVQQYVWGQGYVNDLVLRDRNVDSTTNTPIVSTPDVRLLLQPLGPRIATTTRVEASQSTVSASIRRSHDAVSNGRSEAGTRSG